MLNLGIVGFSDEKKFDKKTAKPLLALAIEIAVEAHTKNNEKVMIVSGLTNIGIPALAYEYAKNNGYKTKGVACKLAKDDDCYPVDEKKIVGEDWGDESEEFIDSIDVLIRIGGGEQSMKEVEMARFEQKVVYEYDLPKIK